MPGVSCIIILKFILCALKAFLLLCYKCSLVTLAVCQALSPNRCLGCLYSRVQGQVVIWI